MSGPDGGSGVAVLKGCSNPEGAMAFNDWFNTQVDDLATQGLVLTAKAPVKTPESISTFSEARTSTPSSPRPTRP